jgi:hypothetical protein
VEETQSPRRTRSASSFQRTTGSLQSLTDSSEPPLPAGQCILMPTCVYLCSCLLVHLPHVYIACILYWTYA